MKRIKYILSFLLLASLILPSCRKIEKVLTNSKVGAG